MAQVIQTGGTVKIVVDSDIYPALKAALKPGANVVLTADDVAETITVSLTGSGGSSGVASVNGRAGAVTLSSADVGLGNVDNTADAFKAVSTAVRLATPRNINGVAFDGSAPITINAVDSTARQPLDGDLTAIAALTGTNTLYYRSGVDTWSPVTFSGITFSGGQLTVTAGGSGTVTNVSGVNANGVAFSITNPATTPAITISLGAITPTSVAATGTVTGSNLTGTNTGDQTSVTGNAGTATKLATARNINGVAFDGTAAITITANWTAARTFTFSTDVTGSLATDGSANVVVPLTIAANAVTNAKLAQIATGVFKARATAGTGNVEDLTGTQATALLDTVSTTARGLVPVLPNDATKFLNGQGAFTVPPSGGTSFDEQTLTLVDPVNEMLAVRITMLELLAPSRLEQ